MRTEKARILIAVLGAVALAAVIASSYGGGQEPFTPGLPSTGSLSIEPIGIATYQLSTDPNQEILFLTSAGGTGPSVAQYRLFGGGRLVREFVYNKAGRTPWRTDEVQLSTEDIELLFQLAVESELPDLTEARARQKIGRQLLRMDDGSSVILHLHFDVYQRPGEPAVSPFSPRVSMHAPGLQARFFPQLGEAQALGTLRSALDEYFTQPASEVIHGRKK